MRGHVMAVVGGQMGSEGKGVIVGHLAKRYQVHVRVGAPNAGHSFWHLNRVWKMQSIPVGWKNPGATLIIGRGALVSPAILQRELDEIEPVDPTIGTRLYIDEQAGVLDQKFHDAEGGVDGDIHQRIGSTGEGVGAARVARISRDPNNFRHFRDLRGDSEWGSLFNRVNVHQDTPRLIRELLEGGCDVLLEGSQGSNLSLIHGPWPYVTSTDCNSAQIAADCGIAPRLVTNCILVVRTHPIRVAGNSGPLKNETSWDRMSSALGKSVLERTTVTLKVRRIGGWDDEVVDQAVLLNEPTSIALTFMDYLCPEAVGATDIDDVPLKGKQFVEYVERRFDRPVTLIGTGPSDDCKIIERSSKL